ncbi:MAG: UDP-N-acetylmuramate--L-alanine ligase [Phycisphaerales bacterium]|nr:UDP-N-acetylmuramate--L-alanine ligase [Phycisphaerales bacterium]
MNPTMNSRMMGSPRQGPGQAAEANRTDARPSLLADGIAGRRIHMIGVGGCGMFGAARILLHGGARISGSDQKEFAGTGELVAGGAKVCIGHKTGYVDETLDFVVRSAAVPDSNPEVATAYALGIPVLSYAELLGELTRTQRSVALTGTHGKSTTTALTTHLMRHAGLDPSFIVGAESTQLGGSSGVGSGAHFVVEACEYARSFLNLRPHSAAILNVEADHLDCYRDLEDIVDAFGKFAGQIAPDGLLVVSHEDRVAKRAARKAACTVQTFGFGPGAYWRATNLRLHRGCYTFTLRRGGKPLAMCRLQIAGMHNVSNSLAAAALAAHSGAEPERIAEAMGSFTGIHRRMMHRGTGRGVTIVDDYAHHPTEIRATLAAIRSRYAPKRTWVVFQPHQASRTRLLMDDFAAAFADADVVLIPDIYSVRDSDADRQAVTSSDMVSRICSAGRASHYLPSLEDVCDHLERNVAEGDVVVTMGAGDVWKVADGMVERIC